MPDKKQFKGGGGSALAHSSGDVSHHALREAAGLFSHQGRGGEGREAGAQLKGKMAFFFLFSL